MKKRKKWKWSIGEVGCIWPVMKMMVQREGADNEWKPEPLLFSTFSRPALR